MAISEAFSQRAGSRWWSRHKLTSGTLTLVLVLLAALLAARLYLPTYLQNYVNGVLDRNENYDGRVGHIDVHLWRGAYSIRDVDIVNTTAKIPVPLFSAPRVEISVSWEDLWHGAFVGRVTVFEGKLNFARGGGGVQTGEDGDWIKTVRDLSPIRIDRFEVFDSEIHYRDFTTSPHVDIFISSVNGAALNLTNSRRISDTLAASLHATGLAQRHAETRVKAELNPFTKQANFSVAVELSALQLPLLNSFLEAYAKVDAEKGTFSLYSEAKAVNDQFDGYAKVLMKDVELLSLADDSKNPFALAWEGVVAAITEIFSNQREDQIATRVPFSGTLDNPDTGALSAIVELLKNAFVEALKPGLDDVTEAAE